MNEEINRIRWKCRRGMREIDLLLREFSITKLETLNEDELSIFSDILNYDDQKLYDFIFTKSHQDSEDLTQQTFLKVWQQLKTFRGDSAFFTWVYRIAINLAKNYVSSSGYKKQKLNISVEDSEIEINSFKDIELELMHDQSLKNIKFFIDSMPESLRTAFTMREQEGLSYDEISKITETPIGTVRSRIFRARESILEYINTELITND